jgi:cobalt-zinc-cadmium efflux system protein
MRREGNKRSLTIALVITLGIMIAEAVGGWLTNSLALLSDSGHMLSDTGSLALSLMAVWFAAKPASPSKSYGYHRFEILAALLNGLALFAIALVIIWEAYSRFMEPQAVNSGPMMLIAFIGLVANLVSAWVLLKQSDVKGNINLRSAYLHMISDALGAVGAIIAGFFMYQFGWYIADPVISVVVSLLILKGAWSVVRQSIHILMEGTPGKVDIAAIHAALATIAGVINIHDVHVWTVASGYEVFSCHMLVRTGVNSSQVLSQVVPLLEQQFGIRHTTIQVMEEDAGVSCWGCRGGMCTFSVAQ